MFHFEEYIMTDSSSSESNPVVTEVENTWKIPVVSTSVLATIGWTQISPVNYKNTTP
jgi:hypothetical protein